MPHLVMLAHKFEDHDIDPTGWFASEKLDGVRGLWTGKEFISRNGKPFHAPEEFTRGLPNVRLDGELWLGRGMFNECSGIVRRHNWGRDARRIRFVCFDAPDASGGFEDRLDYLEDVVAHAKLNHLLAHKQTEIPSRKAMDKMLAHVEKLGGEGLIIRAPGSTYEYRRSHECLKVKSMQDDEAVITEHYSGPKGKPGVYCDWKGTRIKVANGFKLDGSNRPPVGTRITFGFFERTTKGMPRFPTFIRVAA